MQAPPVEKLSPVQETFLAQVSSIQVLLIKAEASLLQILQTYVPPADQALSIYIPMREVPQVQVSPIPASPILISPIPTSPIPASLILISPIPASLIPASLILASLAKVLSVPAPPV